MFTSRIYSSPYYSYHYFIYCTVRYLTLASAQGLCKVRNTTSTTIVVMVVVAMVVVVLVQAWVREQGVGHRKRLPRRKE